MPVTLHDPANDDQSSCALELHDGALAAPRQAKAVHKLPPQLAIKANTQPSLAQELPSSPGGMMLVASWLRCDLLLVAVLHCWGIAILHGSPHLWQHVAGFPTEPTAVLDRINRICSPESQGAHSAPGKDVQQCLSPSAGTGVSSHPVSQAVPPYPLSAMHCPSGQPIWSVVDTLTSLSVHARQPSIWREWQIFAHCCRFEYCGQNI